MSDPLPFKPRHLRDADQAPSETSRGPAQTAGDGVPPKVGSRRLRWLLPLVVLLIAFSLAWALVASREDPEQVEPVMRSPLVRVVTVEPEDVRLTVIARGSVAPRTESDLVAEVRGRVLWVSPDLVVGGFFSSGDELLRLDDREHRIARDRARSTRARTR